MAGMVGTPPGSARRVGSMAMAADWRPTDCANSTPAAVAAQMMTGLGTGVRAVGLEGG